MKLIVTNPVTLNGGDAAILLAMKRALESCSGERLDFVVSEAEPIAAARYFGDLDFRSLAYPLLAPGRDGRGRAFAGLRETFNRRLLRALMASGQELTTGAGALLPRAFRSHLREYAAADGMVSAGGTYLVENYFLEPRLLEFELARSLGTPLVLYTQSLGPFRRQGLRDRLRRSFDYASLILLRDPVSRDHVLDLGVDARKCVVCADAVFGLYEGLPAARRVAGRGPAVAVCVRDWRFFAKHTHAAGMERYLRSIAGTVARLVGEMDARVTFVSTCQGVPEYWTDDSRVAREAIECFLPGPARARVTVDGRFRRAPELIEHLRQYDFAISTRMHFAILSMLAGVPALAIAYEFKTQQLYRDMGLGDWVEDIEVVTPESLFSRTARFHAAAAEVRARLERELPRLKQSALRAAVLTLEAVRARHARSAARAEAPPPASTPAAS